MKAENTNVSKAPFDKTKEDSLKGTLFSVGVVGAVILLMWVGVFWLYMSRI